MAVLACASLCSRVAVATPEEPARVLVLHSYHPGYEWTDLLNQGMIARLVRGVQQERIYVEYLDSRRFHGPQHLAQVEALLRSKYHELSPNVLLTSDDDAFRFILSRRDTLFPGVPVVFCGINAYERSWEALQPRWFTGIVEGDGIEQNLRLIRGLHPNARRIVVVTDPSPLGVRFSEETRQYAQDPSLTGGASLEIWDAIDAATLEQRLTALPRDTPVFLAIRQRDPAERYFSYTVDVPRLVAQMSAPIYAQWGFLLGRGVVGGYMNDPREHGEIGRAHV